MLHASRVEIIESDSDSDSFYSEYSDDEEATRIFGSPARGTEPKYRSKLINAEERKVKGKSRRLMSSEQSDLRQQEGAKPSKTYPEKANASKKLKAAALSTMMFRSRGSRASDDADTASQGSKTSRSIGSNDTGKKNKLAKSSTMDTSQKLTVMETSSRSSSRGNRPARRITADADGSIDIKGTAKRGGSAPRSRRTQDNEFEIGSSKMSRMRSSDGSIDIKGMAKRKGSATRSRRIQDNEFSTGSSRMSRDEMKPKSRLRRSVTDIALSSRGSSIGSRGSNGNRRNSSLRSYFGSSKKSEGTELNQDSYSRRRRVREIV